MMQKLRYSSRRFLVGLIGACLVTVGVYTYHVSAITPLPTPEPKPGSYGLEATKKQPPPTRGATITVPGDGASFSNSPVTVSGICPDDLLVQLYNNGVMVGSVMCEGGSFKLEVSLFAGVNELSAIVYDFLDQAGPTSNTIKVTYTDTQFAAFGAAVTLTSAYGRRSTAAGNDLDWPLQLSGGTGPYAFSIDWGDGVKPELKSQSLAGLVTIAHPYKKAGIYHVNVTATDVNGVSAFLQMVAVSNGKLDEGTGSNDASGQGTAATKVMWIPAAVAVAFLPLSYWLGRRSQVVSLRNKMLKDRDSFGKK